LNVWTLLRSGEWDRARPARPQCGVEVGANLLAKASYDRNAQRENACAAANSSIVARILAIEACNSMV
jgi:hypothetical protein